MISLTITVDNIGTVMEVFNTIQIRRYTGTEDPPPSPVTDLEALSHYTTVSGTDVINSRELVSDVLLNAAYAQYYFTDVGGEWDDWYTTRYYNSFDGATSGWSDPVQGEPGTLYYNPQYPPEITLGTEEQAVLNRIRILTGDPLNLRREYGTEALSSIHTDGKTYEMDEKGWPVFVSMGGKYFVQKDDPSVNGYRFLRFQNYVDDVCTTCTGITNVCGDTVTKEVANGVDIWYYTFRHSDKEIMDAYNNTPPPVGLTTTTANTEAYMLACAYDLLYKDVAEIVLEDGNVIRDEGTLYDPTPGIEAMMDLLDKLKKRLDDIVKQLKMTGIEGVRLD